MTPLWCPICGREALEVAEREMGSAAQPTPANNSCTLVCHCIDGHRFVMSLNGERLREPCNVPWEALSTVLR